MHNTISHIYRSFSSLELVLFAGLEEKCILGARKDVSRGMYLDIKGARAPDHGG